MHGYVVVYCFTFFWEGGSHTGSPIDIPLDTTHGNSCPRPEGERGEEGGRGGGGEGGGGRERENACLALSFQSDTT